MCVCVCVSTCIYVFVHIHIYIYIYIHMCMYTHSPPDGVAHLSDADAAKHHLRGERHGRCSDTAIAPEPERSRLGHALGL